MYYNKDLFAEHGVKVPENFEEMVSAVKAFAEKDVIPLAIFAKENWPGVQLYDMLVTREQNGGLLRIDSGDNKIDEDAYRKAAVKLKRLVDAGIMSRGSFNTSYDEALALFTEGQAAMFLNGMWCVKDLGERMSDSVDIMPHYYPLADAGMEDASEWHMSGGSVKHDGLSAFGKSPNLELASRVTVFFAHKYAEGKTVKMGYPSLFIDTPATELSLTAIHQRALEEAVNYKSTSGFPWHISNPETRTAVEDAVARMLAGSYDAEAFIKDLTKQIR
jgi:raffinose/stachyose/melibiose transport system substrate-binding protein